MYKDFSIKFEPIVSLILLVLTIFSGIILLALLIANYMMLTTLILTSISLLLGIMLYFNIVLEYYNSFFRSSKNLTREERDNKNKREMFKGVLGSSILSKLDNYKMQ